MDARELQQTFTDIVRARKTSVLYRAVFEAFKFPAKLRDLYYDRQEQMSDAAIASDIFREAYPNFPAVVLCGVPSAAKAMTRIDLFWSKKGNKLVEHFEELMATRTEDTGSIATMQLYSLPYLKSVVALHNATFPRPKGIRVCWETSQGEALTLQTLDSMYLSTDIFRRYVENAMGDPSSA